MSRPKLQPRSRNAFFEFAVFLDPENHDDPHDEDEHGVGREQVNLTLIVMRNLVRCFVQLLFASKF